MMSIVHPQPFDLAFTPAYESSYPELPYDDQTGCYPADALAYLPAGDARSDSYGSYLSAFDVSAYGYPGMGLCASDPVEPSPGPIAQHCQTTLAPAHQVTPAPAPPMTLSPAALMSLAPAAPVMAALPANRSIAIPRRRPSYRQHGPMLLPKIRTQDQALIDHPDTVDRFRSVSTPPPPPLLKRARRCSPCSPAPASVSSIGSPVGRTTKRPCHSRSFTNPESIAYPVCPTSSMSTISTMSTVDAYATPSSSVNCSPVAYAPDSSLLGYSHARSFSAPHSFSSADSLLPVQNSHLAHHAHSAHPPHVHSYSSYPELTAEPANEPPSPPASSVRGHSYSPSPKVQLRQPIYQAVGLDYISRSRSQTPSAPAVMPVKPATNLLSYLSEPNPAPSVVASVSFPLRDAKTDYFWWDVRQIRPWTGFTSSALLSLPGAASVLSCPVSAALLPVPSTVSRRPETELALHRLCANFYLPKVNAALAASSSRSLRLSIPADETDLGFTANPAADGSQAILLRPSAHVVGLVRSYERFNSGMRADGNIKRVEYLRGLAALHDSMRTHGCRYGFIMTEIELVVVRNGAELVPNFGFLEVAAPISLATSADASSDATSVPLTACLALWGLCMIAADSTMQDHGQGYGHAHWRAAIGAPAQASRHQALPRDGWMPVPQVAEKRQAKRVRGWVWPEDPVGKKEAKALRWR